MTKRQVISKMKQAGIKYTEINGRGNDWEVELPNDKMRVLFGLRVCRAGGYKTGYGAWIMQAHTLDMGDYNDRSSRWHY